LANRTYYITDLLEGYAVELWAPVMPWTYWYNTVCEGAFPTSLALARAKLDGAGFTQGTTGPLVGGGDNVRVYPSGHEKAGADLDPLIMYIRSDDPPRRDAGIHLADQLNLVGVPTTRILGSTSVAYYPVFFYQDYHIYTGGWGLSIDPDYLWTIYGGEYINWPNYNWYNSTAYTAAARDDLFLGTTLAQCLTGAQDAQEIAWGPDGDCPTIPLWTAVAASSRRGYYNPAEPLPIETGTGEYAKMIPELWEGWVNGEGAGLGSYNTVHPEGYDQGGILRIGQHQSPIKLNILKSEWEYEYNILLLCYDFLMTVDPYTYEDSPYLADSWEISSWMNPDTGNPATLLMFTLEENVEWHDGEPFTSADVEFSLEYYRDNQGWWYSNVQNIVEVITPDDHTVLVYLNVESFWALHWIGLGVPIFPKHIWEAVPDPTVDRPDPGLTGTGMYDFISYDEDAETIVFNAHKADAPFDPYPNAPIRTLGKPRTYAGTYPTGYGSVTRKTVISKDHLSALDIELKVKNSMAHATATYSPPDWSGTWTVSTTVPSSEGKATTLTPGDPPTTLTYTAVDISGLGYGTTITVSATHNNQVGSFLIGTASIDVVYTFAGDIDGNSVLNLFDPLELSVAMGVLPDGCFVSNADINGNGLINVFDSLILSAAFAA
jgi:ABC-type transport system substrate-binding protein